MKLEIVCNNFVDKSFGTKLIKSFQAYLTNNRAESEEAIRTKKVKDFLGEMITSVEKSLISNASKNFYILMSKSSVYAVKIDNKNYLSLRCDQFNISVIKTPSICVPNRLLKTKEEKDGRVLKGFEKYFLSGGLTVENKKLLDGEEVLVLDKVRKALEKWEKTTMAKDLSDLPSEIQYEMTRDGDYQCLLN